MNVGRLCRALWIAVGVLASAEACAQDAAPATLVRQAAEAMRVGKYDDAISLSRRVIAADSTSAPAVRTLLRGLLYTGKYAEAIAVGRAFARADPKSAEADVLTGDGLARTGDLAGAAQLYRGAVTRHATDSLVAELQLAKLEFDSGGVDSAMKHFDRFIDVYNTRRTSLTSAELQAVAEACRYLGRDDPQLFKDALKAFDESISADSTNLDARVALARLFLEKYNGTDARSTLDAVLKTNPHHPMALLAMSTLRQFEGGGDAAEYVRRALEVNGALAEARAQSALLLVDLERYDEATEEARLGLAVDSGAYEPAVALAAARFLKSDTAGFQAALAKALARRPRSADAEATLADVMARNRLYAQAVEFSKRAIARDGKASRALAFLGINALRIGQTAEGRSMLQRSFALDPYDVWAKNTLDLLDTYKDYDEVKTPRFVFLIEKKDAPLLSLYAEPLAEAAYDSLASRYGFRPQPPVRVEVYRSHADFSVRTVGLAGLGALGVSFGNVVAIDGPAARKPGEFNWGSTLWHELAHTFTLGSSDNRVPRWLSEGLSVYEERRARPGWGADISPQFAAAFKGGQLVTLARMNDGFMRPRFPEQLLLSYYQASLLCELIERDHGIAALRTLLSSYRKGLDTDAAIRAAVNTDLATLQQQFDDFVRQKFAVELSAVDAAKAPERGMPGIKWEGKFADEMKTALALAESKQWDQAVGRLEAAKKRFPSYAGEDSPYALLARIALERADTARAIAELTAMTAIDEDAYDANRKLADLLVAKGDSKGATRALDRAMYIFPHDLGVHATLAQLAGAAGDHAIAIRERRAVVALDPTDRVEAIYQLALAYADAGDRESARRQVLQALELAPNFEKAQELLLKLRGS